MDTKQFGGNLPPLRPSRKVPSYGKSYTVGPLVALVFALIPLALMAWVVYFWICVAGYVNAWPF